MRFEICIQKKKKKNSFIFQSYFEKKSALNRSWVEMIEEGEIEKEREREKWKIRVELLFFICP